MDKPRSLSMDVKVGESLSIDGGRLVVVLERKSGQRVKLRFIDSGDVKVERRAESAESAEVKAL